ncbi:MAG: inositol monophosphatase family protein [Bacteriovoracaceae bacterium]
MLSQLQRQKIKDQLHQKLQQLMVEGKFTPQIATKEDNSLVTEVDQFLSDIIKIETSESVCFFSEEDHTKLTFPAVILDPIDGTIEFAQGVPECAVSYAAMKGPDLSEASAWIYNPFTGFEISSDSTFTLPVKINKLKYLGLVSRSEWKKGLYDSIENGPVQLSPRGSIAFKLGLLATGACDFVVSKKAKNIWDIAAGSILLHQRGFSFYEKGIKLTSLNKETYEAPLLWCRESDFILLSWTLGL